MIMYSNKKFDIESFFSSKEKLYSQKMSTDPNPKIILDDFNEEEEDDDEECSDGSDIVVQMKAIMILQTMVDTPEFFPDNKT